MTAVLTGPQKAAVLLIQMGKERSAAVLRSMREHEIEQLMAEVAQLQAVNPHAASEVLTEVRDMLAAHAFFAEGGIDFARDVMEQSLGAAKAEAILDRLTSAQMGAPFEFLRRADPRQILSFLQDEHPQTIALVLAHMRAEQAALVMSGLPEELQGEVAHRIAVMDRTSPEVVREVEGMLQRKLSTVIQSTDMEVAGGVQPLVDIINRADRATEKLILEGLEQYDAELAEEVRSRMFVFEDITSLDDRSIQLVLREVDNKELSVALKGVRQDVRDKILKNMSERAAQNLGEEIELLGPIRLKQVEEAQGAVVRVIRTLEEAGQIVLSRGGEEFIV